jgi:molybdate transport system substrate-binding protein
MPMCAWRRVITAACLSLAIGIAPLQAAELKVLSDGPLRTALVRIVDDFRIETGHSVVVVYATAPELKTKIAAGELADVLISLAAEVDDLARSNKFAATQVAVASIKLGLAIRKDIAVPDIGTLDAFKQALLRADSIIHNNLASGRAFARQLERIGMAEQLKAKIVEVQGNGQLAELAKRTGNDLAAGQLTQIIASRDVKLVGALPPEAQSETVYSAGVFSDSRSLEAAKAFALYLASPKATAAFAAVGAK